MDNPADLGPATEAVIQELIAVDGYASRDEVLRAGVEALMDQSWHMEPVHVDQLDPDIRAAVERGLADVEAGRTFTVEEVFEELERRCAAGE